MSSRGSRPQKSSLDRIWRAHLETATDATRPDPRATGSSACSMPGQRLPRRRILRWPENCAASDSLQAGTTGLVWIMAIKHPAQSVHLKWICHRDLLELGHHLVIIRSANRWQFVIIDESRIRSLSREV